MLSRALFEVSRVASSGENGGSAGQIGEIALVVLFAVIALQWDITRLAERDRGGKSHHLLGYYVVPLAVAAAVVLGSRVALLLFGG